MDNRSALATIVTLTSTCLAFVLAIPADAQVLREDFWVPNGQVEDLAIVGDAVYLGGDFTQVGPATGAFVGLDAATGSALQPLPRVMGMGGGVFAVVSDGADGWYIGGAFSSVRGQPRSNLAHLDAAGNVTSWNPGANGTVYALARDAATGVVYVGGSFSTIGGQSRLLLAAIDATGAATAFDASFAPSGPVLDLILHGGIPAGSFLSTHQSFAVFFGTTTGVEVAAVDPTPVALRVTPNPFHSQVGLSFSLPRGGDVEVSVYDLGGPLVRHLERGARPAGEQRVLWDGRDQGGRTVGAGVYLVRVRGESLRLTAKVLRME